MWIKDVNFPESLLAAQKSGSLVIFAGAGVSVDPPSNYPNFSDLADEIADGVLCREKQEPIDHFLGRLVDKRIEVHRRVCEILSNPSSQPNPLHFDLLRLFPSASQVRLVTTNFDTHFTTTAKEVFKDHEPPEIFRAPALPLGHQFTGIVYLHGCVDQEPERLILTDRDFGRAYLTEGWARKNVLPLLDWSIDKRRAQQAWHGFLFWGRLHEVLLTELIPLYEKSFTHVQTEVDELR